LINLETIVFAILALIAVAAAVLTITSRNAVHSALFLVVVMSSLAVFFLGLWAPFVAMVQVAVYAGAIMVLFLFVIMLLGAEKIGARETYLIHMTHELEFSALSAQLPAGMRVAYDGLRLQCQ